MMTISEDEYWQYVNDNKELNEKISIMETAKEDTLIAIKDLSNIEEPTKEQVQDICETIELYWEGV